MASGSPKSCAGDCDHNRIYDVFNLGRLRVPPGPHYSYLIVPAVSHFRAPKLSICRVTQVLRGCVVRFNFVGSATRDTGEC